MPDGLQGLTLIVFDDRYERVHYALAMAAAAAASNRPTRLFFAGPAVRALLPDGWRTLAGAPEPTDQTRQALGIAGWETLAESLVALGVPVQACEIAVTAAGLVPAQLTALPATVTGLVGLYGEADGQMVFV